MREKKDRRLFFALWPERTLRERLQQAADGIALPAAARRVPPANLHLTLHFVGNVYLDEMDCMRAQAALVDAAAFDFDIDTQGFFRKPRVAWLGCGEVPDALTGLHRQLGMRLQDCGYRPEARPYHPHVTVARKTAEIDTRAEFEPLRWRVRDFALVEVLGAENGVQYRVAETWPLK